MHATPDKKSSKPHPTLQSLNGILGHSQTTRPFSAQERRKSQNGEIGAKLLKSQRNLETEYLSNCSDRTSQFIDTRNILTANEETENFERKKIE
ncbi:unnamed protein product, partial [Hymenolepis diminuta]